MAKEMGERMTREETKKFIMGMQVSFPNFKIQDGLLSFTIDVWQDDLADFSYEEVCSALKGFKNTSNSGFAPSVSQLIDMIHELKKNPNQINGNEAWTMVYKALCNSTYNAESEFAKLPPLVQKAIGSPNNLRAMAGDPDFNFGVEQSNFIRIYEAECKRAEFNANVLNNAIRIAQDKARRLIEDDTNK